TEDLLKWINGEISDDQITSGSYLRDWVNASKLGTAQYQPKTMSHDDIMNATSLITNKGFTTTRKAMTSAMLVDPATRLKAAGQQLAHTMGPSLDSKFEAGRQALIGTPLETMLVTPQMVQKAGFDPNTPIAGNTQVTQAASILQMQNPRFRKWFQQLKDTAANYSYGCTIEQPEPDAFVGLARQAQRLYPLPQDADKSSPGYAAVNDSAYPAKKMARDQALHQWIREQFNVSVIAHEMGHSMGLRHNFTGSWDAMNYRTQYWQLRTRNGAEKACTDMTTPHVNGADCVGPRWIDPVTDNETNGLLWKWGSTTVMDYPGDSTQDMNDIGNYDKAAMRFGYAGVVDVDQTSRSAAVRNLYYGRYDGFGGISGPWDVTAFNGQTGDLTSVHYSQFNDMLNGELVGKCTAQTDPNDLLSAHCDGVPLVFEDRDDMLPDTNKIFSGGQTLNWAKDSQGRIRHPYMFGSDEFADFGNVPVFRFDAGADAYEQAQFIISTYENRYIFNNFRRDRMSFNTDATVERTMSRYLDKLTSSTKALGLYFSELGDQAGNFVDPNLGLGLLFPHTLASQLSMNEFMTIITRPEPGTYYDHGSGVLTTNQFQGNSALTPVVQVSVGSGEGRFINNDYDYSKGYWWADYQTQVGSYYEKVYSTYYMTEAYNDFVQNSRDQYVDGRYLNINYSTLYPDQMRRFISGIMQNDLSGFAPFTMPPQAGNSATTPMGHIQYLPWQSTGNVSYPAGALPIDPVIGWEEQYPALIFSFIYGSTTLTEDWVDEMRVYSPTGGDTVSIPDNQQYVYNDPVSGLEYVARDYGTETVAGKLVQRTSGARMLEYANSIAQATFVNTPDPTHTGAVIYTLDSNKNPQCAVDATTCEANKQTLRNYASNLDTLRQIVSRFGYGNLF
ncbi:MAG: hypothetical protein ACRELY_05120, partial [Polyangiaceae bacterium]